MNMHVFGPAILMFTRVLRFCPITVAAVAVFFFLLFPLKPSLGLEDGELLMTIIAALWFQMFVCNPMVQATTLTGMQFRKMWGSSSSAENRLELEPYSNQATYG